MVELDGTDLTAPDGTRIRRWGRVPADATQAVLFVHGAIYGGRSAFDPAGFSWLDDVAASGSAAYAVDVRGYSEYEHPPELDAPADQNDPVVRASTAAGYVEAVCYDLRDAYESVHLVGYSWGTIIAGVVLRERDVDVRSPVQYTPVYRPPGRHRDRFSPGDPPAAYRRVTRAQARERWADQRHGGSVPDDALDAFWDALVSSGQRAGDDEIVAPNGTLVDLGGAVDAAPYDAGVIDVPTLVAESLDTASTREDALGLFDALGAADSTYVELAGGTHFMQLEAESGRPIRRRPELSLPD